MLYALAAVVFALLALSALALHRKYRLHLGCAQGTAWRSFYVTYTRRDDPCTPHNIFYLGLDPDTNGVPRLVLFGGIANRNMFRIPLVTAPFPFKLTPTRLAIYRAKNRLICGVDGRYGWGTTKRREAESMFCEN